VVQRNININDDKAAIALVFAMPLFLGLLLKKFVESCDLCYKFVREKFCYLVFDILEDERKA